MKTTVLLLLSGIFLLSGCAASDGDILKALKLYGDKLCACKTEACGRDVIDEAMRNPTLLEAEADDPSKLKQRLGERFTPLEKQWDTCRTRLFKTKKTGTN
jgi:hypothetical protein